VEGDEVGYGDGHAAAEWEVEFSLKVFVLDRLDGVAEVGGGEAGGGDALFEGVVGFAGFSSAFEVVGIKFGNFEFAEDTEEPVPSHGNFLHLIDDGSGGTHGDPGEFVFGHGFGGSNDVFKRLLS
jgi:hypothetical protein